MVMAFWNAPIDEPEHAQKAVTAALAIRQRLATLRQELVAEGLPPVAIGIGLNTGPMNVGDMGSQYRRAYTVIGDAVNLGSRLESLTRFYGVDILLSQTTKQACHELLFRPVDRIRVRGKTRPIDVFEPVCRVADAAAEQQTQVARLDTALTHYRNRQFVTAAAILRQLRAQDSAAGGGRQRLYSCYLQRIDGFLNAPPAADWDGVFVHTGK